MSTARDALPLTALDTNSPDAWRSYFVSADALESSGRVGEALGFLETQPPPGETDSESWALLKTYRGSYTGYLGRYPLAYRLFDEAEAIAREANLLSLVGNVYLARGFILFRQKDYLSSKRQYRCALELAERIDDEHLRSHGLWGIGKNLMIQERYEEGIRWLDVALALFEKAGSHSMTATVWSELAICHLGLGDEMKAMNLLKKAEQLSLECSSRHNYQVILADIGNVFLHRREYFAAIDYYRKALEIAREIRDPVSVQKWTRNINLAYARIRRAVDHGAENLPQPSS